MLKDLNKIDIQSLNTVFSGMAENVDQIIWMRSADFKRQLYISKNFESIFNRPCTELYQDPTKFSSYIDDHKEATAFDQMSKSIGSKDFPLDNTKFVKNYFRLRPANDKTRFSCSIGFPLFIMDKIVAFAGIDVELPETQWEEEATKGLFHIKNKEMIIDLKSILQNEFALVTQQSTPQLQTCRVTFPNNTIVPLTKREAQCLQHLLAGHSAKVTGNSLFLSQRTVEEYLNNIRNKFNARSKLELISLLSKAKINF